MLHYWNDIPADKRRSAQNKDPRLVLSCHIRYFDHKVTLRESLLILMLFVSSWSSASRARGDCDFLRGVCCEEKRERGRHNHLQCVDNRVICPGRIRIDRAIDFPRAEVTGGQWFVLASSESSGIVTPMRSVFSSARLSFASVFKLQTVLKRLWAQVCLTE